MEIEDENGETISTTIFMKVATAGNLILLKN
jgi:hypothetical protein